MNEAAWGFILFMTIYVVVFWLCHRMLRFSEKGKIYFLWVGGSIALLNLIHFILVLLIDDGPGVGAGGAGYAILSILEWIAFLLFSVIYRLVNKRKND